MSLSISTDEPTVDCLLMAGSLPQDVLGMAATVTSYDQVFGPDHPQTLAVIVHFGRAIWRCGYPGRGRQLLERASLSLSRRLPREHSITLLVLGTLGQLLFEQGDFCGAYVIQRDLLERWRVNAGPKHPDTIAAEKSLAATVEKMARCTRSLGSFQEKHGETN